MEFRITWIMEQSFYTAARKDIIMIFASYNTLPIFYGLFSNTQYEATHSLITSFMNLLSHHEDVGVAYNNGSETRQIGVFGIYSAEHFKISWISKTPRQTNFKYECLTSKQRKYNHKHPSVNQWFFISSICSKSHPDDDSEGSKRIAVRILYTLRFDVCLFTPYDWFCRLN